MIGVAVLYDRNFASVFIDQAAAIISIFFGCSQHYPEWVDTCQIGLLVDLLDALEKASTPDISCIAL